MHEEGGILSVEAFRKKYMPHVGRDAMYALVRSGRMRCIRIGRRIFIPESEARAFVDRETQVSEPVSASE